ncbi:MAG: ABC transporter ATP-binding protein [Halobacteriaceae archaeon]
MPAIEVDGVTKRFGDVTALQGLDLEVREGEIFGFLGPNGAGKSTTIDILLDFVRPTSGTARVLGHDSQRETQAVRERTAILPDEFDVYDRLTGRKHLEFAAESRNADDDPDEILRRVGLEDAGDRKAGGYSTGMRKRLVLGMTLVGEPDLLILDEPTTGLDPNGAREMRDIIREERERGATVFFSSHILEQVEAVADRVGILRRGQLVAEDSIEGLREATGSRARLTVTVENRSGQVVESVRALDGVDDVAEAGVDELHVTCDPGAKRDVLDAIEEAGGTVADFSTKERSLEDLFHHYTAEAESGTGTEAEA